jgi:predicted Holliday junction resolvase-like endonuclease
LEGACTSLRGELNNVHRRLLAHLEGRDLPLRLRDGPSKKANYKIMAARLQHEIKELQQKVKAAKLRLESETKLKEQAERETRDIRNDLSHKKVVMSLARSQNATLPTVHPRTYDALVY